MTNSPCGILLKLIFCLQKQRKAPITISDLEEFVFKLQSNYNIEIYHLVQMEDGTPWCPGETFRKDLFYLLDVGQIRMISHETIVEVTIKGSVSAQLLRFPEDMITALTNLAIPVEDAPEV
jgi:hypothetical protein